MTLSNLINLAVLLMTGIALWVTILQARDARISRTDAARSAASAALSARDRVEALTRTAGATEQIAGSGGRSADALERIAEPSSPLDSGAC